MGILQGTIGDGVNTRMVDEEKGPKDLLVLRNNGILLRWSNQKIAVESWFLVIYRIV